MNDLACICPICKTPFASVNSFDYCSIKCSRVATINGFVKSLDVEQITQLIYIVDLIDFDDDLAQYFSDKLSDTLDD
jgi:phage FluMu protein Com